MCSRFLIGVMVSATIATVSSVAHAQNGGNVLVVINAASNVSVRVGEYYARARSVPAENIVRLSVDVTEEITRERYERDIERAIGQWITRNALQDRILYMVLAKGMPLRIEGTAGRNGTASSVDSELTLLYRKLVGARMGTVGPVKNPYFVGPKAEVQAGPFKREAQDVYLVTRLDGFTEADAIALVDRGIAPLKSGTFLLDGKGGAGDGLPGEWLQAAADSLAALGYKDRVILDVAPDAVRDKADVLGYASWGSNDPSLRSRRLPIRFAPGALAAVFVSTDARTMTEPPQAWQPGGPTSRPFAGSAQSLAGDLIKDGVTGTVGQVGEPFIDGTIRPDILFSSYVKGLSLVEAFYSAIPYLSWQTIVFGDPLCAPFRTDVQVLTGDDLSPGVDPETDLPKYFAARRVEVLAGAGVPAAAARLVLNAEGRIRAGDSVGAKQVLEQATVAAPKWMAPQLLLATTYEQLGEHDRAIERYRRVLELAPEEAVSLNNLAHALAVYKNEPTEALPLAQKAYASSGGQPSIADTLGLIHHMLGNQAEAEKLLVEAAAKAPDAPEIQLHLAQVYLALDRRDAAVAALSKCIELNAAFADRDDVKKLRQALQAK